MSDRRPPLLILGDRLVTARGVVLSVASVVVALFALALPDLRVGYSIAGFFRSSDPELRAAMAHYEGDDPFEWPDNLLLFGWAEQEPTGDAALQRLRAFRMVAEQSPLVQRIVSLENAPLPGQFLATREQVAASQTWRRLLVGKDGDAVGGVLVLRRNVDGAPSDLFARLRAAARDFDRELNLCGIPHHRAESTALVRADLAKFLPIGTLAAAVFLFWLIPHWLLALQALLVVPLTLTATLGTMAMCGTEITMLTSTLPTLLMCMSVADGVHMVGRFLEERQHGLEPRAAAARTLAAMFWPCLLTSATTIAGFLSLTMADLADLRELGAFAALGMVFAFVFTMACLPPAMSFVRGVPGRRPPDLAAAMARGALWISAWRPARVLVPAGLLAIASVAPLRLLQSDHRLTADLWADSPPVVQMAFYERHFAGVLPVEVLVRSASGFADAAVRRELTELCTGLEALAGTSRTLSIADLFADGMSPTTVGALARTGTLPAGLLDRAGTTARILVLREDLGSASWQQFLVAARQLCARPHTFAAGLAGVQLVGTAMVERLTWDLVWSFFGSLVVIFLLVFLQCRDLRLGACAMLSCLLPLLLVLATMALCGIAVRPLTMIAFCVSFGLMIDDAIHVVARWREERLAGAESSAALRTTIATAGRPVVVTTVLLLVGFVTILGSEFKGTFAFGLLVSLSLVAALASALLVLPALLRVLVRA